VLGCIIAGHVSPSVPELHTGAGLSKWHGPSLATPWHLDQPMKPFLRAQLHRYTQRLTELDYLLSREDIMSHMEQFLALSREHAEVSVIGQRWSRLQQREQDLAAAQAMLGEMPGDGQGPLDADMRQLAQDEIEQAQAECAQLEAELQRLLLPRDPDEDRNAFLEIRAGTGGDESALFAADLLRMYTRYAESQGWRVELMSESPSELGGYKEVVLRVEGQAAYGRLRFESGGHRVQRVPVTESQGRIHTSACTVAVMPEPDEATAVQINPADLRIDTFRASGAGGQHINKTDSAVRVTHIPTGIVAECQDDRSQHRNKARALQVLAARIQERERAQRSAAEAATRKGLIGSGDRSDRIRTYNFPQGRLTDHRINLTLYKLAYVMEGQLGDVLEALHQARQTEKLEALEVGGWA
jgi:peptide chain release factor 1